MGSYAYLCVVDEPRICPIFLPDPARQPAVVPVAFAKYALPTLWALLFEAGDLLEADIESEDGESIPCWAPMAHIDRALDALHRNAAKLVGVFGSELEGYVDLLAEELRSHAGPYVTLDLLDLVVMSGTDTLRLALAGLYEELATPTEPARPAATGLRGLFARPPKIAQHLAKLNMYRPKTGLLDARCLITNRGLTNRGLENHWAMLGSAYDRPVAWEPGPPVRGTAAEVIAARTRG